MGDRITREEIHMRTAILWSERSLCKRLDRKIGVVITDLDMKRVLSVGYNGPPRKLPHDFCRDQEGNCGCLHAEINALMMVDNTIKDKVMFVTMSPCESCAAAIIQAGFSRIYYHKLYRNNRGKELLEQCKILISQINLQI